MANVTNPRLKTFKIYGNVPLLFKNVTFNDPFDFKLLNVANCYICICQRLAKVKNVGRIPGFLNELGPILVFTEKIGKFQPVSLCNLFSFIGH